MSEAQLSSTLDLAGEIAALKQENTWAQSDRVARTLVKRDRLQLVLTMLKADARLHEHHAEGRVTVQTITGHLRLQIDGQSIDLPAGHVVVIEPGVLHDVQAVEESAFLLTIAA